MFIRIKKVKKRSGKVYEYAHLVEGIWRRRRLKIKDDGQRNFSRFNNSIHKYKKFLGRVYRFNNIDMNLDSEEFFNGFESFVMDKNVGDIYKKLVEYELLLRNFRKKKNIYMNRQVHVDLKRLIVHDGQADVVIKLRDFSGYLCSMTLEDLFNIKKITNKYEGMYLMKKLKAIGIKLNHDQFFILANRLLQEDK